MRVTFIVMRIVRYIITCLLLAVAVGAAAQPAPCTALGLPLAEGFDSYGTAAMPPCWCSTGNYDMGAMPHLDASRHFTGSRSLYLYSGTLQGHYSMAISPELALESTNEVYLKFRFFSTSTATRVEVGMCDDTNRYTRHFVPLDTLHAARPGQWQEMVVALPADGSAGTRLAFRLQRSLQVEVCECFIDDLRIGSCGTMVPEVSHLTSHSMTVTWERYGSGAIALEYNGQRLDNVTSPLTLTGLQPLTHYTVSVGCTDSVMQEVSVTTLDATEVVPSLYEPFAGNALPAGWQTPLASVPTVGGGKLTLHPAADDSCLAVLPPLHGVAASDVTMALRLQGTAGCRLVAGVMDYALEAESFVPLDTLVCGSSWQRHVVDVSPYSGSGLHLALLALGDGTVTVDDLRVARCLIDSVQLSYLADSSVTVAWDTLTPLASAVTVEYGPRGFASGSGTTVTATANPFTLTGLTPSIEYDLVVAPACGDVPCSYDRHGALPFGQEVEVPYCVSFEGIGSGLPQGWVCGSGTAGGHGTAYQGSRSLRLTAGTVVALPRISMATGDSLILEFYGYGSGRLEVGLTHTPFAPFTPTDTLTGTRAWKRYMVAVAPPEGQLLTLRSSNTWYIDLLAVHANAVTTTTVNTLRQTSAHVAWTLVHSDSVALEYKAVASSTADFAEGSGTTLHALDSVTLTGLEAGTHYALHLRPLSDGASCHWQTLHLLTAAAAQEPPICEDFNNLNDFPASWRRLSDYGEYPLVSSERNHSPAKSMRFSATATKHTVAMLPDFTSASEHLTLLFWTNATLNPQGAMLLVGRLDDITDISSFHATDTLRFNETEVWRHHQVDLGTLHEQIALMLVGGNNNETRLFIDDICVHHCIANGVRVSHIDTSSLTFEWNGDGIDGMTARLSSSLSHVVDTFHTSPATIDSLTTNSPYQLTLKSFCDCGSRGAVLSPGSGTSGRAYNDTVYSINFNSRPSTTSVPYCQDFESHTSGTFPYSWRRLNGLARVSDRNYHNGGHSLLIPNGTTVVMPPIGDISSLVATFYLFATDDAALADGALLLGILENPDSANSLTVVDTLHLARAGEWQRLWSDLSAYSGSGRTAALRLEAADSCTVYLDDLSLSSCGFGTLALRGGDTVEWEPLHSPTQVALEYGPQGFTPGDGQRDTVTASPYVLANAVAGTNYDIYLKAFCGERWSCTPLRLSSSNATVIPYCEDFASAPPMSLPTGWTMGRTYSGSPAIDNGHLLLKGHSGATHRSIAVLPPLDGDGLLQLSMSLRGGTNGRLALGHIASNADPNTFVALDTAMGGDDTLWHRYRSALILPAGRRLAIACFSIGQEATMEVDTLAVTRALSPHISVSSARTLVLDNNGDSYIEYGPAGFVQGTGALRHLDSIHYELGGLQPEETYWLYSREDALSATCLPPDQVTMPAEAPLPYCLGDTLFQRLQLPELNIDSVSRLHLYVTLEDGGTVVAGVMETDGGWDHFTGVDTLTAPAGTRRQLHLTLAGYTGRGRFVGLLNTGGAVRATAIAATDSPWVTARLNDDNSVTLSGHGKVLYGLAGFTPDQGTVVTVDGSLTLNTLEDTTVYDFYPLAGDSLLPCLAPQQWHTSTAVAMPYCVTYAEGLPLGWTVEGDALDSMARVENSALVLTALPGENVLRLPQMAAGTLVADMEVMLSGASATLTFCGDTVPAGTGGWQRLRMQTTHEGRPSFVLSGSGTARVRSLKLNRCALPGSIAVGQPGGGTTVLEWDATEVSGPFFFEYHLANVDASVIVRATEPPLTLQLLSDTTYQIVAKCDSLAVACQAPTTFKTLAEPQELPYCVSFDTTLPEAWHSLALPTGETLLVLPQFTVDSLVRLNLMLTARLSGGSEVTLGVMSDAGDISTFDSLTALHYNGSAFATRFYTLRNYFGHGHFLALRFRGSLEVNHLSVSDCAAFDFRLEEEENDHVTIGWEQQGTPTVTVEYGPMGFTPGTGRVVTAHQPPLRIDSLEGLTNHAFYVSGSCDNTPCRPAIKDTFMTFTPQGGEGCIDYTDLYAPYVSCKYGTYSNPSENTGVVNLGFLNAASRHTIHFDTTERDARTGGLLRTVPEGKMASVRLGNWLTGNNGQPQAENITYGMTVDTTMFNLLVLRYAAVLQDPEHSPDLQPRFRLQILNSAGDLIDSCGLADFIANPSLIGSTDEGGWNQAANEVLWKDWTTVGIDLTAYSGQTIFIRLTTNDCGEGSHYGYAYFTLECATKRMQTEGCSYVPDNRFTVPSGFRYRWYSNHDTTTFSTASSIWVASDNSTTYYCQLSFIDKPSCNFTMSAFAGARFPLAIIDTLVTVANCEFDLVMTDRSTISSDGVNPVGTGEGCESRLWLLPDGSTSTASAVTMHLTDTADIDITLIAGIADDQCIDTLQRTIRVRRLYPDATIEAPSQRCDNDGPDGLYVRHATSYHWSGGGTGPRQVAPTRDTTVTCYTVDTNGCRDTLRHTLRVFPTYDLLYSDSVCNTDSSYRWIDTTIVIDQSDGIIGRMRHLTTGEGCDSLMTLSLQLMPSYYLHHYDTLCHDSQLPFFDTVLTTTGDYLHVDSTAFGCDSMVTMHLEIVPRVFRDDERVVCDSLVWVDGHTYRADTAGAVDTLSTPRGCDSVVTLLLTVHYSTLEVEVDTFCQGSQYPWRSHLITEGGRHADTLRTIENCDSVLAIDLTRLDLPTLSISSDYDCQTLDYEIRAHSDVPYLLWSSYPVDSTLQEHVHDSILVVHPDSTIRYILYADYAEEPHCPARDSVTIKPATLPKARLRVSPLALVAPANEFDAMDVGQDFLERAWYLNGELQDEDGRYLHVVMPEGIDTMCVMLLVTDGHCEDSASVCVPRLYNVVDAPNTFLPDAEENNIFRIVGKGILEAEISIYNRFGTLVYRSNDINEGWNGISINGDRCPMGAYVWILRYTASTGGRHEERGTVLLVR